MLVLNSGLNCLPVLQKSVHITHPPTFCRCRRIRYVFLLFKFFRFMKKYFTHPYISLITTQVTESYFLFVQYCVKSGGIQSCPSLPSPPTPPPPRRCLTSDEIDAGVFSSFWEGNWGPYPVPVSDFSKLRPLASRSSEFYEYCTEYGNRTKGPGTNTKFPVMFECMSLS